MAVQQQTQRELLGNPSTHRRADWLGDSIVSGFLATFAMSVVMAAAFGLAQVIGDQNGSRIEQWFWALTHNPVIETTQNAIVLAIGVNLLMGIVWALVYGYDAEPRLSGPGWRKGMLFSLGPWLLSIFAFFPIMDGGILGKDIHAGPLPVIGNLILHLVYGAVLGSIYAIDLEAWLDGSEADRNHAEAQQRGAAFGTVAGMVIGLAVGWLLGPSLDDVGSRGLIILIGALTGGALGLAAGSLAGPELADHNHAPQPHAR
jgi:MFS family permease